MTQETWDRSVVTAMVVFGLSVGSLTLLTLLLMAAREAEAAAHALEAAAPGGLGVTIALRHRGGK